MSNKHDHSLAEAGLPSDGPGHEHLSWAGVEAWLLLAGVGAERCLADAALGIRCALQLHATGVHPTPEEADFAAAAFAKARPMLVAVAPDVAAAPAAFAVKLDRLRGTLRMFGRPEALRTAEQIDLLPDVLDEAAQVADVLDAFHRAARLERRGDRLRALSNAAAFATADDEG